jgi:hypothetical protein
VHVRAAGHRRRYEAFAGCVCWCPGQPGAELGPAGASLRRPNSVAAVLSSCAGVQLGRAACACAGLLPSSDWPVAHGLMRIGLYLLAAATGLAVIQLPPLCTSRRLMKAMLCVLVKQHCCKSVPDVRTR